MLIDNHISPEKNLLNHINKSLGPSVPDIDISEVSFSNPRAIKPKVDDSLIDESHPNSSYIHNTEVTLSSTRSGNTYQVRYRRINIPKQYHILSSKDNLELDITNLDDENMVRSELKKIWDFYDSQIVITISGSGNTRKVVLEAKENSLLYVEGLDIYQDSDVKLTLTISKKGTGSPLPDPDRGDKTPIGDIINDHDLDSDNTLSNHGEGFFYDR